MGVGSVVGVGSGVGALDSGFLCVGVAALSFSSFTPSKGKSSIVMSVSYEELVKSGKK